MKAITIKQPWAYLICAGIKDIENRTWYTKYRGRVYIHAAAKSAKEPYMIFTDEQAEAIDDIIMDVCESYEQTSAIIGHVDIVDCVINHDSIWAEKTKSVLVGGRSMYENGDKPIYNWVLRNPVLFDKPILNVKGKLSFWDYPNINCEPDEDGRSVCLCNLPINEKDQVINFGNGDCRCAYCDGKWYK